MTIAEAAMLGNFPNYVVKFDNRKRILLLLMGPLIIGLALALKFITMFVPGTAFLGILGFLMFWFGLWMPFHAVFGYSETWRIEEATITRFRQNWVWKGEKNWRYGDIRGFRIKAVGDKGQQRPEFYAGKWLSLPAQPDIATAEQLKTEIGNFKRAAKVED